MPNAIVTGATRGIGKSIADLLLANGFSLAVCARSQNSLDELEREWRAKHLAATILYYRADLSSKNEGEGFAQAVLAKIGEIDMLVNNAGLYLPGSIAAEPDGQLELMINTNLYSAYWLTRQLLPVMVAKGSGHIFNMCSIASLKAYPNGGAYSISKYALLGFSDNLREELKGTGLKVTSVCPGATYTPSWEGSGVPEERIMAASDIAAMVWSTYGLSVQANVETIIMRPVLGDL